MSIDYKNVYRDIAPKEVIIAAALAGARIMAGGGMPTLEQLKSSAYGFVTTKAVEALTRPVNFLLENAVAEFEMTEGERPEYNAGSTDSMDASQAWRDKFDEFLIAKFGKDLERAIGPSAIGEHFTDSDVDNAEVRLVVMQEIAERLAEAAQPMDNANTTEAKPSVNKTLSAAGVVDADFIPHAAGAPSAGSVTVAAAADPIEARGRVERIVGAYALNVGTDNFDPLTLDEILSSAFEDDVFIGIGGIERLGGSKEDQPFFLAYIKAEPLTTKGNTMAAALAALANGKIIEPPKTTKPKKVKVTKGAAASLIPSDTPPLPGAPPFLPQETSGGASGAIEPDYTSIVTIWTQHGQDGDDEIATALGVSRGTVGNLRKGKDVRRNISPEARAATKKLLLLKARQFEHAASLLG